MQAHRVYGRCFAFCVQALVKLHGCQPGRISRWFIVLAKLSFSRYFAEVLKGAGNAFIHATILGAVGLRGSTSLIDSCFMFLPSNSGHCSNMFPLLASQTSFTEFPRWLSREMLLRRWTIILSVFMQDNDANFGSTETYHVVNIRMYLNTMESCRLHVEYNFMRVTVFLLLRAINSNEKWKKEKPVTIKSNEIKFLFYQLLPCYIQHLKARARSLIQRSKRL